MTADGGVWIFGNSGFIGTHLAQYYLSQNISVTGFSRTQTQATAKNLYSVELELSNLEISKKRIEFELSSQAPNLIVYAAAYGVNPAQAQNTNLALTINTQAPTVIAQLASQYGVKDFMYLGSCFEYGHYEGAIKETAKLRATSVYGQSKAQAMVQLQDFAKKSSCRILLPRLFGQWGPGESESRLVPQLLKSVQNRTLTCTTPGEQIRDLLYVKDTVKILDLLVQSQIPSGQVVNVGSGQPIQIKDFILNILTELKSSQLFKVGDLAYRQDEMMSLYADLTELKKWVQLPPLTDLAVGLREMT